MIFKKRPGITALALICVYLAGILLIVGSGSRRSTPRRTYYQTRSFSFPVATDPPGATISLDGKEIGVTPMNLSVTYTYSSSGYHNDETRTRHLKVSKKNYSSASYTFSIKGKEFERIPNPIHLEQILAESVSITGSAGLLSRVTTGGPGEKVLDLSPDKAWLLIEVFETGPGASGNHVLQKINLATRAKVLLSPKGSNNREAVWHPSGTSMIFVSNRLGTNTLVQSLGIAGEVGVRFITQPSLGSSRFPAVTTDGKDIAFSIGDNPATQTLAIVQEDGANLRMFDLGSTPCWSGDSKTLLFVRKVGDFFRIFSMDAQTGTNLIELSSTACNDVAPQWSPSGNHIAFISDRVNNRKHLYIMNSNGQNVTQLTDGLFDIDSIHWGKDGFIYFSANAGDNWDVWRLKPKGF
jgi:hypothetical protein